MSRNLEYDRRGASIPEKYGGRVRFSLRTDSTRRARRMRDQLDDLLHWQAFDVLHAIEEGVLDVRRVVEDLRSEGKRALEDFREDIRASRQEDIGTLEANRDAFLRWYQPRHEENSYRARVNQLKRLLRQPGEDGRPLGEKTLHHVSSQDIETALQEMDLSGWSERGSLNAIRRLYSWAIRNEADAARKQDRRPRFERNPADDVRVADPNPNVETAQPSQFRALLSHAKPYMEPVLRAGGQLGIRTGAILHTRYGHDLDMDARKWRIQEHGPDPNCPCEQCKGRGWSPKSDASHRTIPLPDHPPGIVGSLERYFTLYPADPGERAFRNPNTGRLWRHRAWSLHLKDLCEEADVQYGRDVQGGVTLNSFRHMCATQLLMSGVDIARVARLLGHTVQTAADYYIEVTEEDVSEAIQMGPTYD